MESSEMLDVIHYLFEEDVRYASAEQAEAVSNLRTQLYLTYGKTYKYGQSSKSSNRNYIPQGAGEDFGFEDPMMSDTGQVKGYIPPTEFNPDSAMPFGSVLDSPLG
jgi:hypothetical protein